MAFIVAYGSENDIAGVESTAGAAREVMAGCVGMGDVWVCDARDAAPITLRRALRFLAGAGQADAPGLLVALAEELGGR